MLRRIISSCSSLSCKKKNSTEDEDSIPELQLKQSETNSAQKTLIELQNLSKNAVESFSKINQTQALIRGKPINGDATKKGVTPSTSQFNQPNCKASVIIATDSSDDQMEIVTGTNYPRPCTSADAAKDSNSSYLTYWKSRANRLVPISTITPDKMNEIRFKNFDSYVREILEPQISKNEIKFIKNFAINIGGHGSIRKGKVIKLDFKYIRDVYYFKVNKSYVAAKSLETDKFSSYTFKAFVNETAILKKCNHPNILKYVGIVMRPINFYLITEWCDGLDLHNWINKDNRQKWRGSNMMQIIDISLDTSRGLEYLHSLNIIHRDIKSPNILLFPTNNPPTEKQLIAKICDFGLAYSPEHGLSTYNTSPFVQNVHAGTVRWMAPEIQNPTLDRMVYNSNIERYSRKSDVYSFGVVLSELLSGEPPFSQLKNARALLESGNALITELMVRADAPQTLTNLMWRATGLVKDFRPFIRPVAAELAEIKGKLMRDELDGKIVYDGSRILRYRNDDVQRMRISKRNKRIERTLY